MNKTTGFSYKLGRNANFFWSNFIDPTKVDRAFCEQHDCLHRSYGTAMTAHCGVCFDEIFNAVRGPINAQIKKRLKSVCGKCETPPVADPALPAPFPNYAPPEIPEAISF